MVRGDEVERLAENDHLAVRLHDELGVAALDDEFFSDGDLLELSDAFQRGLPDIGHLADADLFRTGDTDTVRFERADDRVHNSGQWKEAGRIAADACA